MNQTQAPSAIFLLSVTVFDDRAVMAWSSIVDGEASPTQWIGRASAKTWADTFGSILDTDTVMVRVTDRRTINRDTGKPWQEDDAHGARCAQRFMSAAECTCGKGDAMAAQEGGR